jgi:hypothetical protein
MRNYRTFNSFVMRLAYPVGYISVSGKTFWTGTLNCIVLPRGDWR